MEYALDKVKRVIDQVSKLNEVLTKSREKLDRNFSSIVRGDGKIKVLEDVLEELEEFSTLKSCAHRFIPKSAIDALFQPSAFANGQHLSAPTIS